MNQMNEEMIKEVCLNCKYFYGPENQCRRNPPTHSTAMHMKFPRVDSNEWCGEFVVHKRYEKYIEENVTKIGVRKKKQ